MKPVRVKIARRVLVAAVVAVVIVETVVVVEIAGIAAAVNAVNIAVNKFRRVPSNAIFQARGSAMSLAFFIVTGSSSRLQLQKVFQNLPPAFCQNAFGMKLNAPDGILLVLHAHDFA